MGGGPAGSAAGPCHATHLIAQTPIERVSAGASGGVLVPFVDHLFASAAGLAPRIVAVVLSGMGRDGAAGAARLAMGGADVIVQSAESAIIDGMPRATLAACPGALSIDITQFGQGVLGRTTPGAVRAHG